MSISPARMSAFEILMRIETERAFSSILLPQFEERLSPRDRGLCHQLTLGVLRNQMYLDRAIDHYAKGKRLDPAVRMSLRLGLYQLLFLDKIPDHSAVNESVELVGRAKKASARGFVNAVLRRSLREPFSPAFSDDIDRVCVETSHPRWLIERWIKNFGFEEVNDLAAANNAAPMSAYRITMAGKGGPAFDGSFPSENVPGCYLADPVSPEMREAAGRGEIYFQDEGSQLVGSSIVVPNGGRFLDVCAAPGSKVTQIAGQSGSAVVLAAGDIHHRRVRFLKENIRDQGLANVDVIEFDAEKVLPFENEVFDAVLVDAPCSGTGTIRHNPEIRYFLAEDDISVLSGKQRRILSNASKTVKRGGILTYSTCSLEPEENEKVAEAFLADHSDFRKARINVPERFVGEDGYARTRPHRDKMDGFFIARFERASL